MSDPRLNAFAPENPDNVLARMRQGMVPQAQEDPAARAAYLMTAQQGPPAPVNAFAQGALGQAPQQPVAPTPIAPHGNTRWHEHIAHAHALTGVPVSILDSVIMHESNGNPDALSPVGAIGLMQLMPGTAHGLGVNPHDPGQNILGGAKYLMQQYAKFKDWNLALAAYNAGPGAVQKYGGIPPYKETQNYVTNIQSDIHRRYGGIK